MEFFILFPDIFFECFRNLVESQKQFFFLILLKIFLKKAGDYNPLRVLELRIIYTTMFYIPFHWEKKTTRKRKVILLSRLSEYELSSLTSSKCQHRSPLMGISIKKQTNN